MISLDDMAACLDNPWAVFLIALAAGVLGACLISAISNAIWLRYGPDEPAGPSPDDQLRAALARRTELEETP